MKVECRWLTMWQRGRGQQFTADDGNFQCENFFLTISRRLAVFHVSHFSPKKITKQLSTCDEFRSAADDADGSADVISPKKLANEISVNVSKLANLSDVQQKLAGCLLNSRWASNVKLMHETWAKSSQNQMCVNPTHRESTIVIGWNRQSFQRGIKMSRKSPSNTFEHFPLACSRLSARPCELHAWIHRCKLTDDETPFGFGSFLLFTFFASFCALIVR